jgi:hypothetical protein
MTYCALSPVSAAVYAALNVAALTALVPGGIYDDVPQATTFPFLWYEVQERQLGVLGTRAIPEIGLRVHVFSTYEGMSEAQAIMVKVVELLRNTTPAVTGYSNAVIFHDETVPLAMEELNGVKVRELVGMFRVCVQET